MSEYKPPFHMTDKVICLIAEISEQVGRINVLQKDTISPHLRLENRIRTIHSSLSIEHNSLSLEQVTAILDGKRVLGNPNEIKEVQNAYDAYELMLRLDPMSVDDLLKAHKLMMNGLVPENGKFRSGGVGVFNGEVLIHMAPPAEFVPEHIHNLFEKLRLLVAAPSKITTKLPTKIKRPPNGFSPLLVMKRCRLRSLWNSSVFHTVLPSAKTI